MLDKEYSQENVALEQMSIWCDIVRKLKIINKTIIFMKEELWTEMQKPREVKVKCRKR